MSKTIDIANVVATNPSYFRRGRSISPKEFVKLFGGIFPNLKKANIKSRINSRPFLTAYTQVNTVLKHAGRAIKWTDNDMFENLTKAQVEKKVTELEKKTINIMTHKLQLNDGLKQNGNKSASKQSTIARGKISTERCTAVVPTRQAVNTTNYKYTDKQLSLLEAMPVHTVSY
jgi:hypothetical protein